MATYHDTKIKTAQAKAAVAMAKARAPPPGPLLLTMVLTLACFLASDYLLYGDSCIGEESDPGFLQTHLWTSTNGWVYFTLSRLFLSALVFTVLCVGVACLLGCCGFKGHHPSNNTASI